MPNRHTVSQGEHVSRIASLYGFSDFRTIWDHPGNAELKAIRNSPHILLPGDTLYVPDLEPRTEIRSTDQQHNFKLVGQRLFLRIVVLDFDNKPIANRTCILAVEGISRELKTDATGLIEAEIAKNAEHGVLTIPDLDIEAPIRIGHLDPIEEDSGWRARLVNLGYHRNSGECEQLRLQYAIEEFQCDHRLKVTGTMDEATAKKLKEVYGA